MRAIDRQEDIPQIRAALDNLRRHQRFEGLWGEVHPFATSELRVKKNGVVVKTIRFGKGD